ncbi:glycosyltransferase [Sutcliffiella horikoshii]|uniref:glycosyltransferase n=1 Tax=Sutcliffiella horikoshii TaxID=79883 RepID=UPI0038514C91
MEKHNNAFEELDNTVLKKKLKEKKMRYEQQKQLNFRIQKQYDLLRKGFLFSLAKRTYKILKFNIQYLNGKRSIRQLFDPTIDNKKANSRIKKLKYSLYELGFTYKALKDLHDIVEKNANKHLKKKAAWELALWHANKYNKQDAEKCLEYLTTVKRGEKNKSLLRRIAIIEAECLDTLDRQAEGKKVINKRLEKDTHIDLFFARANLESSIEERLVWINNGLTLAGLQNIYLDNMDFQPLYNNLKTRVITEIDNKEVNLPKVTVIMPVFNSSNVIDTSITAILSQTWKNLELIIVDDGSTDDTFQKAEQYASIDERIKLMKTPMNGGAYIARNIGLREATGDFITIHDADDWSHNCKVEEQVRHLLAKPHVIANTTQQARLTDDLRFYRRGKPGEYVFSNMSSLMFRREITLEKVGFWDTVRFGADGEFKRRLKLVFGENAVVDLVTGPFSFQRQSATSLTGNELFGFHGYFMGARKEYYESYSYYHKTAKSLRYDFPSEDRLFPAPMPMLPDRNLKKRRHFDVIIASEFRLLGGTNMSNIEEIKAQKHAGLKTGLIQLNRYDFHSEKFTNYKVRELIDGKQVEMIVYGEEVSCDVLIIRHPPVLEEWQKYVPDVKAGSVKVIVNQPPQRDYSVKGSTLYNLPKCAKHLRQYFNKKGKWYPIGPLVRESLIKHHKKDLNSINLSAEDWVNIIQIDEWKRKSRPQKGNVIKIGRHSRSQYVKWPATRNDVLEIYPDKESYEVYVLGGAQVPVSIMGYLPNNWKVYEFGEIEPKEFLEKLDVFVYYTHPDWIEAFGRVIFEAMAAGVPVIIPHTYEDLFGKAAIYAEPNEVQNKVQELMLNDELYEEQVQQAMGYVEEHFGYTKHIKRIEEGFLDDFKSL